MVLGAFGGREAQNSTFHFGCKIYLPDLDTFRYAYMQQVVYGGTLVVLILVPR